MPMTEFAPMGTAEQRLTALLERHEQEREIVLRLLWAEEQAEAHTLRTAFNENAGTALASALKDIEKQIRQDRKVGDLKARVLTELPGWMPRHMPVLDDDEIAEGARSVVIFVPRVSASNGLREPFALAAFDATAAVFPGGDRS